jgi:TP901 family phage tail tape measure protein
MGKVKESMHGVGGEAEAMKSTISDAFRGFGIGAGLMAAGAAGFAALGPAITESKELSKAIALVATEADLATFPQEKMREEAEKLAIQYGKAPVEQAQALYKAVALGANDAAKSTAFLNGVNLLAVAGNADLELSANALGGALNAYGAPFSKATDFSDTLFVAMKQGNTTVQDLASSIGRVTSSAANLNIPFTEIAGAVSVMTNKGVVAAEAVSGLKEALANVVHPSEEARKEAARLGIHFTQAEVRAKGLQGFLKEITSSSKFTAESFSKLFTSVEGSNAIVQVASGNMEAYNNVMAEMGKRSGATQAGFEIMSQTLDFQEKKFDANKKVLLGMIGQALEPLAAKVLGVANFLISTFQKAPKPLIAFFAKFVAGASAVLVFVGSLVAVKAAISLVGAGLGAIGVTLGGVVAALAPVIAGIALLAAAGYAFKLAWDKNLGGFQDTIMQLYDGAKLTFDALYELFSGGGFTADTWKKLEAHSGIKEFAITVYMWAGRIENFFKGLGSGFEKAVTTLAPVFANFSAALGHVGDAFGDLMGGPHDVNRAASAFDTFGKVGGMVGTIVAEVFGHLVTIFTYVMQVVGGVIDGFKMMGPVMDFVGNIGGSLWTTFGELADSVVGLLVQLGLMDGQMGQSGNGWHTFGKIVGVVAGIIVTEIKAIIGYIQFMVKIVTWMVEGITKAVELARAGAAALGLGGNITNVLQTTSLGGNTTESKPIPTVSVGGAATLSPFGAAGGGAGAGGAAATMPSTAAAGQLPSSGGSEAATKHLETIAKAVSAPQTIHTNVVMDSEVIARATTKVTRSGGARGFEPAPVET